MNADQRAARKAEIVARLELTRSARRFRHEVARIEAARKQEMKSRGVDASALGLAAQGRALMGLAAQRPLLLFGAAAVLVLMGPRRILRMTSWALPLVFRWRGR